MLELKALRLDINTTNGLYGSRIEWREGLNVVRANNTSGKSTLFQSITYALGLEELIGGRYEKTMQSVLKDLVVDVENSYQVLQSSVFLEIYNGKDVVTIRRDVINETRRSQLIDVITGPAITRPKEKYEVRQMYVHDKGAASDSNFGFHVFLEEFLGWSLPTVIDTNGNRAKLYIPLISAPFIIEQKSGWSSFFGTMPFYGIRNAEERVIEFILNLDVFKNEQEKISLGIDKKVIQDRWTDLYQEFKKLGEKGSGQITGLDESPVIINSFSDIYFRITRNEKTYLIPQLIEELQEEYETISNQSGSTVGENVEANQLRLQQLNDNILRYSLKYDQLEEESLYEREKLKQYILQRRDVEEQLFKNKAAEKMLRLGADMQVAIAVHLCPTCGQDVKDSLLPSDSDQTPLTVEDNIKFLTSQLRMLEVVLSSHRRRLVDKETVTNDYRTRLNQLRQQVRNIKRDLISDDRLPSEELIERKINVRKLIQFYVDMLDDYGTLLKKLKKLVKDWERIKKVEAGLAGNFFTAQDEEKVQYLETIFLNLMTKFNYQSKDKDSIKISREKYLPVIEVKLPNGKAKTYDIRFDSSGSDHIRCMWAYYLALVKTSVKFNGNHPRLLLFDEPQQQSASITDFREFLAELSATKKCQTIVFASFQNSQEDYDKTTAGLEFHKIESKGRFVVKID